MKSINNKSKCKIKGNTNKIKLRYSNIVLPIVRRYFFVCPQNIDLTEIPYTISANQFVNDKGKNVRVFRINGLSGYTNVFINGVMQASSLYQLKSNSIRLNCTGQIIYKGTPIIIESIVFKLVKKYVNS